MAAQSLALNQGFTFLVGKSALGHSCHGGSRAWGFSTAWHVTSMAMEQLEVFLCTPPVRNVYSTFLPTICCSCPNIPLVLIFLAVMTMLPHRTLPLLGMLIHMEAPGAT